MNNRNAVEPAMDLERKAPNLEGRITRIETWVAEKEASDAVEADRLAEHHVRFMRKFNDGRKY